MNTTPTMTTQARLKARKDILEARANMRMESVKTNIDYLKSNGFGLMTTEAVGKITDNFPAFGRFTRPIVSLVEKNRRKQTARQLADERMDSNPVSSYSAKDQIDTDASPLTLIKRRALPLLYTLGGMKMLSYSLRGAGKMARSGLRRLFIRRRKRK